MSKTIKIAAAVTLYNGTFANIENIKTYQFQVDKVFVIDNSDRYEKHLADKIKSLHNVVYYSNRGNKGIAAALNQSALLAITEGYDYLLTMDDDSRTPRTLVAQMIEFLEECTYSNCVGIVSATHGKPFPNKLPRSVLTTMTSGNLLSLSIYQKIGPFRENFFIDHVDHEYCLRLNRSGYQVIELPYLPLDHELGERKRVGWFNRTYVSHTPFRGYYYIRNGLVLATEFKKYYPEFCSQLKYLLMKEVIKALLFESKKVLRLRLIWQGIVDAKHGQLGKWIRQF